jgi:maltooligosyltrehalose trehalohydrolase
MAKPHHFSILSVHNGRREEFSSFAWHGEMPNPQSESTFLQCKLNHKLKDEIPHNVLYRFYRELIRFRGSLSDKGLLSKATMDVTALPKEMVFFIRYHDMENEIITVYCFSKTQVSVVFPSPTKRWRKLLDSADSCWGGSGSPTPNLVSHSAGSHVPIGARALVVFAGQD